MKFYLLLGTIFVAVCHLTWATTHYEEVQITRLLNPANRYMIGYVNFTEHHDSTFAVDAKLHFISKPDYPFIVVAVFPKSSIQFKCRISGKPLRYPVKGGTKPLILFADVVEDYHKGIDFKISRNTARKLEDGSSLQENVVVMYTQSQSQPTPSTIACGEIGRSFTYLGNMGGNVRKRIKDPYPRPTIIEKSVRQFDRITDLYSPSTKLHIGTIVWKDSSDIVEVVMIPSNAEWNYMTYFAFVHPLSGIGPGCEVMSRPAQINNYFISGGWPKTLNIKMTKAAGFDKAIFVGQARVLKILPIFENVNNLRYAVVVHYFDGKTSTKKMVSSPNAKSIIGCGVMRPDDGSKDTFGAWAPPGLGVERVSAGGRLLQTTLWANKPH